MTALTLKNRIVFALFFIVASLALDLVIDRLLNGSIDAFYVVENVMIIVLVAFAVDQHRARKAQRLNTE